MKDKKIKRYKLLPSLKEKKIVEKKMCNVCEDEKPLSDFAKSKTYSDGHRPTCKECTNKLQREMYNKSKEPFPF